MYIKTVKIYGEDGHRQAQSFGTTDAFDWSKDGDLRKVFIFREDTTKTNDYVVLTVIRNTKEECDQEISAQLSDGLFENCRIGKVEVIDEAVA